MSRDMHSKLTATDHTYVHIAMGDFVSFDVSQPPNALKK